MMSTATPDMMACMREEIAAYLDGELGAHSLDALEEHLEMCAACASELRAQRRILNELNLALAADAAPEMPKDFAQVVAARAQSDMRGLRARPERRRALRLCAALAAVAFALLGGAAVGESVFSPLRAVWTCGAALFSFLARALYDAGAGVAVISRGVGGRLLFGSRPLGLVGLLLFASALFMLRRLIVGYHRASAVE